MTRSRVSIVRCPGYEPKELMDALARSLGLIGGLETFVRKGARILLKPNLLSARPPEEAVDTHPEFVRAVARLVKMCGGIPHIGDSPGSFFTVKSIDEVYDKSGMKRIAGEEGMELVIFDKIIYEKSYPIARASRDYDLVINLPKMKTHTLTMLTGAVKNTFGFVPGLSKVQCHKRAPNLKEFAKIIVDIFSLTKPGLSIMDGITGMDGDGPAAGRVRKFGLILASTDAVSLDAVFSLLVGLAYNKNLVVEEATIRGLGRGRLEDIEIMGERPESVRIKDFRLPKTGLIYRLPSSISGPLAKLIDFRPVINELYCKKCSICRQSCPADAIVIDKEISRIDEIKCIKCFCCHEVCPHDAIFIKKNIFAKILWR